MYICFEVAPSKQRYIQRGSISNKFRIYGFHREEVLLKKLEEKTNNDKTANRMWIVKLLKI